MNKLVILFLLMSVKVHSGNAESFAANLLKSGPELHGQSVREIKHIDLDGDGINEVLLLRNSVEESAPGFLNIELYDAFTWVDIYKIQNEKYTLMTEYFSEYMLQRKEFYKVWIKRLDKRESLNNDSQGLIEANYENFKEILVNYVSEIENS
jgi:hypothetical protein